MAKVFSNDMVAHVWAQQRQEEGKSGNGNFYFRNRELFSYGSHFLVGFVMPDGVALLNGDSYSVSTSKHQSYAARAVSHRDSFYIAGLTDWRDALGYLAWRMETERKGDNPRKANPGYVERWTPRIRAMLLEHATRLTGRKGNYRHNAAEGEQEEAGAYLARVAGLPGKAWPAIARERQRLDTKAARDAAALKARTLKDRATRLAAMSDSDWRATLAINAGRYQHYYASLAKELFHAKRLAKKLGFSAKRIAMLRQREADARRYVENYDSLNNVWRGRQGIRQAIADVRSVERLAKEEHAGITTRENAARLAIRNLRALSGLDAPARGVDPDRSRPFPMEARRRMWARADHIESVILPPLTEELAAYREAERQRQEAERAERIAERQRSEAERAALDEAAKADWLAGRYNPRRPYFDAPSGGAALRINGDTLETSHGAEVPLSHAIKVFRFVKLLREKGESWRRNGRTVRVGHFQVDRVDSTGDFVAGCHFISWPEVERVAKLAGVFDEAPADAREPSAA